MNDFDSTVTWRRGIMVTGPNRVVLALIRDGEVFRAREATHLWLADAYGGGATSCFLVGGVPVHPVAWAELPVVKELPRFVNRDGLPAQGGREE
jgi:hypothetical protein